MFGFSFLWLCFSLQAFANTEIVNFQVSESHNAEALFTKDWLRINDTYSEHQWSLLPAPYGTPLKQVCEGELRTTSNLSQDACQQELWLVLDLTGQWSSVSSFTLRLSWPAYHPVDFLIQVYDPEELPAQFTMEPPPHQHESSSAHDARVRYARIRVVEASILTPNPKRDIAAKPPGPVPVPFIILVEPLYFGFLPPTVLPVVGYIAVVCMFAALTVPKISEYLYAVAQDASKEFDVREKYE